MQRATRKTILPDSNGRTSISCAPSHAHETSDASITRSPVRPAVWISMRNERSGGPGLYRTLNSGLLWERHGTGLPSGNGYSVLISPANPTVLYACMGTQNVMRSTDSGDTWTSRSSGLPAGRRLLNGKLPGIHNRIEVNQEPVPVSVELYGISKLGVDNFRISYCGRRMSAYAVQPRDIPFLEINGI